MFFTYSGEEEEEEEVDVEVEEVEVVVEEKEIISMSLMKYTDSGFLLGRVTDG